MRASISRPAVLLAAVFLALLDQPAGAASTTVKIPSAAEGIELATDLYLPADRPAPVIVIRTPYGRTDYDFLAEAFARKGYAVAVQDVRGKYDSGGEYEPFRHEREDGLATLRWISGQDWSNGRIGIWGQSYSAYAGLVLADARPVAPSSIFAFSGWLEAEEIVRPGGASHLMLNLPWMITQQGRRQRGLGEFDIEALFRHLPLSQAMRAAGIASSTWEDPDFFRKIAGPREPGPVATPVLHITGWSDMVYQASLAAHRRISASATAPQRLIIGPWFHDQATMGEWLVGDADFGEASGFGVDELIALSIRWFDATLKGEKNGMLDEPPVTYFVMGQNAWLTADQWPPAGAGLETERWYLDSGGRANSAAGDGTLSRAEPSGAEADRFTYDPHDPVPTYGGDNFHFFLDRVGVRDQREIERRPDVLVYTSGPLPAPLQIAGQVKATLHVATSGRDADFTAKLVVVHPDGYARIVEEGISRASVALGRQPSPGEAFSLTVDMGHTAIEVPAGHRLRLEISGSNFPKYDRNPATGEDPFTASTLAGADQTLFHAAGRASRLELPVRRVPQVAGAGGRQPIIRAPEKKEVAALAAGAGDDPARLLAEGRKLLGEQKLDEAVASLERAVELRPEEPAGHLWLGRAYLAQLQEAGAFKKLALSKKVRSSYLRAIELDPGSTEARVSLAGYYFNAPSVAGGSEEKGMEQVEEIRKRDPRAAHILLAGRYAGAKELMKAKEEYRAAIAMDPKEPDAYYRLGLLCQEDKDWGGAFEAFEAGVEATGDLRALYQIGRTGIFAGSRLDRAKAALERFIREWSEAPGVPTVAHARWRMGMVYEKLGRAELAREQYEMSLELDPGLEQAREALETLGLESPSREGA